MKVNDSVTVSQEFVEYADDFTLMHQVFGIKEIRGSIAVLKHETGVEFEVPIEHLVKY